MRVILASKSPRRRELISQIISVTDIICLDVEEKCTETDPQKAVCQIAQQKMIPFLEQDLGDTLVITADTVVYSQEMGILGKPHSNDEAYKMLRGLAGGTHSVYTAVCLLRNGITRVFVEKTDVTFRELTDKEIFAYIETGSPFDKAGGYGVQDCGFVSIVEGSYNNVVGLPTEALEIQLADFIAVTDKVIYNKGNN